MSFQPKRDMNPETDIPSEMTFPLDNNILRIKKDPVFGMFTLHLDKGQLPEKYRGKYTMYRKAKAAVDVYIKAREEATQEVTEQSA